MYQATKFKFLRYVATHRRSVLVSKMAQYCNTYLSWFDNYNYEPESNGEYYVLGALEGVKPMTFFDVGANVGDWAIKAKELHPDSSVHCFEIVGDTCTALRQNTLEYEGVKVNGFGLSDAEGEVEVQTVVGRSDLATTSGYRHSMEGSTTLGRVNTGDRYVSDEGIDVIDFLKIDVEGAESKVIRGFEQSISLQKVRAIQFEYGLVTLLSGSPLQEIYDFLTFRGYVVGKIYPNYVDFRPYAPEDQYSKTPNYLALPSDRQKLIRALGVRN